MAGVQRAKVSHTPGPWFIGEDDSNGQAVVRGEHTEVATCWHHCVVEIEREMRANARLIAAAPDYDASAREIDRLLLVIESAVRNADPTHHAAVLAALKANRAAIAKATAQ